MASGSLAWFPDRGFELDVEFADDEVAIRLQAVPIPADGLIELRAGVELDKLDILFKASVEIEGESGQVQDASVQLVDVDGSPALLLDTRCEDVETGEIVPFKTTLPIELPDGAPDRGGPRPVPTNEDELDWDDETTLEHMIVNAPEAPVAEGAGPEPGGRGLQKLLEALAGIDEEAPPAAPSGLVPAAAEPEPEGDQSMGAADEARGLLQLLVGGENLELEEGSTVDSLLDGAVMILALQIDDEAKATKLSGWLLDQDAVADLFIGDEDLAAILEQW